MRKDFDVIIVGARCAGAGTALLLARAGARVLAIDKSPYGSDTLSTHALMRGAVLQLHRWGVLDRIIRSGAHPVRTTTFGYPAGPVTVAVESRYGVDALYAPRRTVLDKAIADEAELAGAHLSFDTPLAELLQDSEGRVTGIRTKGKSAAEITADLVIGADGVYSPVARRVGAANVLTGQHHTATLYSYWRDFAVEGYEWHYTADASVGAIPTNDGLTCVFVSMRPEQLGPTVAPGLVAGYEAFLRERFPALAPRLQAASRVEPVRGFGGQTGFLKESAGDGWALVGDAGYFKDPLTAHGITDALRDAELLARAVLKGTPESFAAYGQLRHDLSAGLFAITDRIASFDWTFDELQTLHRGYSREMSREQRVLSELEPLPWQQRLARAPLAS